MSNYFFVYSSFDFILLFYNINEARLVLALMLIRIRTQIRLVSAVHMKPDESLNFVVIMSL